MVETFALAPMSRSIRLLTFGLLGLPLVFLWHPLWLGALTPPTWVGLILTAGYASVWTWWRPSHFELSPTGLRIAFPGRTREISLGQLRGSRVITPAEFHAQYGFAVRIGVGGLWGGFGWLWSRRQGLLDFYVSRTDGLVLIERRDARPILITPERPEALVESLASRLASGFR